MSKQIWTTPMFWTFLQKSGPKCPINGWGEGGQGQFGQCPKLNRRSSLNCLNEKKLHNLHHHLALLSRILCLPSLRPVRTNFPRKLNHILFCVDQNSLTKITLLIFNFHNPTWRAAFMSAWARCNIVVSPRCKFTERKTCKLPWLYESNYLSDF